MIKIFKKAALFYIFAVLFCSTAFLLKAENTKDTNNEGYKEIEKELQNIKDKENTLNKQIDMTKCTVKTSKSKNKLPVCQNSTTFFQNTTSYKNNKPLKVYPDKDEVLLETPIVVETNTKTDKGNIPSSGKYNKKVKEYKANYDYEINKNTKVGIGLNHKDKELRQYKDQKRHKRDADDNNVSLNTEYEKDGLTYRGEVEFGKGYYYKKGIKNETPQSHYDYINSRGNVSYKKDLGNDTELVPSAEVEIKNTNERNAGNNRRNYIPAENSDIVTTAGVKLKQKYNDKIKWEVGTEYKQNMKNVITGKSNYNKSLNNDTYERGTFITGANVQYKKDDSVTYKLGYNFEKNRDYNNRVLNFSVTYQIKD